MFHLFGTVSDSTDQQGLDAPFIVELFTDRIFLRLTGDCPSLRLRVSPREDSRRWRMLNEPHESFTRLIPQSGLWS